MCLDYTGVMGNKSSVVAFSDNQELCDNQKVGFSFCDNCVDWKLIKT